MTTRSSAVLGWILVLGGLVAGAVQAGEPVVFARHLSLSPDGKLLAFSWSGDIWTVSTSGGQATRLTVHPARESHPVFSRDGARLAFASDRDGAACVYLMGADGSGVTRLTFGDQTEFPSDFSADDRYVYFHSRREGQNFWEPMLYRVPVTGGQTWRVVDCFGAGAVFSPNGSKMVFERGRSEWWRRKYKGSASHDLWLWSAATEEFRQLTDVPGMDRLPQWDGLGEGVYFLSDRAGNVNVWLQQIYGPARQVTFLEGDDVRDLAVSADGRTLACTHWDRIYVMELPGGVPRAIPVSAAGDSPRRELELRTFTRDADEMEASPDGKEIAFVVRGEIFVIKSEPDRLTRRVTNSPYREQNVTWSPDGKALYFISDEPGQTAVYRARSAEQPPKALSDSLRFHVERITTDDRPEFRPLVSPDGRQLAFLRERGDLYLRDLASGEERLLLASWNPPNVQWSPDSRWLAYEVQDEEYNPDIWVVPADGSQPPVNISQHPNADANPQWSADGQMLAFTSRRMGSDLDLYFVFLSPRLEEKSSVELVEYFEETAKAVKKRKPVKSAVASGDIPRAGHAPARATRPARPGAPATAPATDPLRSALRGFLKSLLDDPPATTKPARPPARSAEAADAEQDEPEKPAADGADSADKPRREPYAYDLATAWQRVRRVVAIPGDQSRFALAPDGASLALVSGHEGSAALYFVKWNGDELKKSAGGNYGGLAWTLDGQRLFYLRGGVPGSCKPGGADAKEHGFSARLDIRATLETAQKFDDAARTLGLRFYHPSMKDTDWPALSAKYRGLALRVHTPIEFCEVFNMLQGELNASHLNCFPPSGGAAPSERLGYLGVEFDPEHEGPGLRVRGITPGGPADRAESRLRVGDVLLRVNGVTVGRETSIEQALFGTAGEPIVLELEPAAALAPPADAPDAAAAANDATTAPNGATTAPAGGLSRELVIRPTTYGDYAEKQYLAWVEANRRYVAEKTDGRVGYAHIRAMSEATFHVFERDLYAAGYGKQALIIDVRNNTGGFTTDWVMNILMYQPHCYAISRGGVIGYPQDRRITYAWTRPATLMCNQYSFSNGEIISHAFKTLRRGPLVGVPTWGGVISTGRYGLIDGTAIRMPTRGWYLPDGTDMENNGAIPDIFIPQTPTDEVRRLEPQLDAAIRATLEQLR